MTIRFGAAVLGLAILAALAGVAVHSDPSPRLRELKDRVEIEGTLVCIGCALEQQDGGANSQCTLYARHAQGVQRADGTLWTIVDNQRGHALITNDKLRGQAIRILGWTFPKAQYLEVWRYSVRKGEAWEGWDWCKVCGYEPGDNRDTDLCADCAGN